jgi:hypothetical protein
MARSCPRFLPPAMTSNTGVTPTERGRPCTRRSHHRQRGCGSGALASPHPPEAAEAKSPGRCPRHGHRIPRRCAPPCGLRRSPLRPSPPPPSTPASRHRPTIPLTRNEIARPFPTLIIRPRPDIACGGPPGVADTSPVPANTTASGAPRRGATIEARAMPGTAGGYSCQRPTDWRRISATSGGRCPHQSAIAARGNGRGAERWTEARLY